MGLIQDGGLNIWGRCICKETHVLMQLSGVKNVKLLPGDSAELLQYSRGKLQLRGETWCTGECIFLPV